MDLRRVGSGTKLHIPLGHQGTLCEIWSVNNKGHVISENVVGEKPTCSRCLKRAKGIAEYLEAPREVAI